MLTKTAKVDCCFKFVYRIYWWSKSIGVNIILRWRKFMARNSRQSKILELISLQEIETQEELAEMLQKEGIDF